MPLFASASAVSARSLGLTSGLIAGPASITSILGNQNSTTGTELLVYFTPGTLGSSPVTDYQYSVDDGSTWSTFASPQTTSPLTVSGLTNGTTYTVKIRSLQGLQASDASNSATGRPVALPGAPTITTVTNDANGTTGGTVSLAFTAGSAGTDSTTKYQYSIDNGATWLDRDSGTTASPLIINGLVNGTTYSVKLRAVTSINDASVGSSTETARPVRVPGAPSISAITASTGQLSIAFSAGSAGTDATSTYEYSLDGGLTWTVRASGTTASPLLVTGTNDAYVANSNKGSGTVYSVQIRAFTSGGHYSASSSAVEPAATLLSGPVITGTSKTPTTLSATFTAPTSGSFAVDYYERSLDGATWTTYVSGGSVTDLSTSTAYTLYLRAVDVQGLAGTTSSVVITTDPEVAPTAPASISFSSSSTTSLTVTYGAATAGTYAISGYEYSLDGTTWVSAGASPFTISGLSSNVIYTVRLRAFSTAGLRGTSIQGNGQVNPETPAAPTASFYNMTTSSYGNVVITITKPTYATVAYLEVVQDGGSTTEYNSTTNSSLFVDNGTSWRFTLAQLHNQRYRYRARTANRIGGIGSYGSNIYWTTPKKNQAYSASRTREFWITRTDVTPPTGCSGENFYGISYGTVPSSSDQVGYINITSLGMDLKCGNSCNPDVGTRIVRFNYRSGTSQLTANFGSSYATYSVSGINAGGSTISNNTVTLEMLNDGATLINDPTFGCIPNTAAYFVGQNFYVSGVQTTAGSFAAW